MTETENATRHDTRIDWNAGPDSYTADCATCGWHWQVHYGRSHAALTGDQAYDVILPLVIAHRGPVRRNCGAGRP